MDQTNGETKKEVKRLRRWIEQNEKYRIQLHKQKDENRILLDQLAETADDLNYSKAESRNKDTQLAAKNAQIAKLEAIIQAQ